MYWRKNSLYGHFQILKSEFKRLLYFRREKITIRAGSVKVNFDVTMKDSKDWFFPRYQHGAPHEPALTYLLAKLLHKDDVFFDLGAHVGYFTWLAAKICHKGQVHAFEMDPSLIAVIASHSAVNSASQFGKVFINCVAVSDNDGSMVSFAAQTTLNKSTNQIKALDDERREYEIRSGVITIDSYLAASRVKRIDILKMDIEGAEALAIRGMRKLLSDFRPVIISELHTREINKFSSSVEEFIEEIRKRDYRIGILSGHRRDAPPVVTELVSDRWTSCGHNECLVMWPTERRLGY